MYPVYGDKCFKRSAIHVCCKTFHHGQSGHVVSTIAKTIVYCQFSHIILREDRPRPKCKFG